MHIIEMERNMDKEFYTPEEVAEILQLHQQTILLYIKSGKLPAMRLNKGYRVKKTDLDFFIQERMT